MIDLRRRLLLSEIDLQCGFALKAYSAAAAALERRSAADFWYSLQALLGAACELHRFLVADADLRTVLRVQEGSSLLRPELDFADNVEASFQQWIAAHRRGPLRSSNFGPGGVAEADPGVFARYFDVNRSFLILFGRSFDLAALLASVAELGNCAKSELSSLQKIV